MKVSHIGIERRGTESDPGAEVVVYIEWEDGTKTQLGSERLSSNFCTYWNILNHRKQNDTKVVVSEDGSYNLGIKATPNSGG